jgi:hypothetical protein
LVVELTLELDIVHTSKLVVASVVPWHQRVQGLRAAGQNSRPRACPPNIPAAPKIFAN